MTQEELIKKIKTSMLEILLHSAVLTITLQFGEIMTEDAKAFTINALEQDIQFIKNNI